MSNILIGNITGLGEVLIMDWSKFIIIFRTGHFHFRFYNILGGQLQSKCFDRKWERVQEKESFFTPLWMGRPCLIQELLINLNTCNGGSLAALSIRNSVLIHQGLTCSRILVGS